MEIRTCWPDSLTASISQVSGALACVKKGRGMMSYKKRREPRRAFSGNLAASVSGANQLPFAIDDLDHHARTLIEPEVISGAHAENAVGARHVFDRLQRITQRFVELRCARLRYLQRGRYGRRQQMARIPGM